MGAYRRCGWVGGRAGARSCTEKPPEREKGGWPPPKSVGVGAGTAVTPIPGDSGFVETARSPQKRTLAPRRPWRGGGGQGGIWWGHPHILTPPATPRELDVNVGCSLPSSLKWVWGVPFWGEYTHPPPWIWGSPPPDIPNPYKDPPQVPHAPPPSQHYRDPQHPKSPHMRTGRDVKHPPAPQILPWGPPPAPQIPPPLQDFLQPQIPPGDPQIPPVPLLRTTNPPPSTPNSPLGTPPQHPKSNPPQLTHAPRRCGQTPSAPAAGG